MGALPDAVVIERCSNLLEVYYTWPGIHRHTHTEICIHTHLSHISLLSERTFLQSMSWVIGEEMFQMSRGKTTQRQTGSKQTEEESFLVFRLWPLKSDRIMICKLFITVLSFFVAMGRALQKNKTILMSCLQSATSPLGANKSSTLGFSNNKGVVAPISIFPSRDFFSVCGLPACTAKTNTTAWHNAEGGVSQDQDRGLTPIPTNPACLHSKSAITYQNRSLHLPPAS